MKYRRCLVSSERQCDVGAKLPTSNCAHTRLPAIRAEPIRSGAAAGQRRIWLATYPSKILRRFASQNDNFGVYVPRVFSSRKLLCHKGVATKRHFLNFGFRDYGRRLVLANINAERGMTSPFPSGVRQNNPTGIIFPGFPLVSNRNV